MKRLMTLLVLFLVAASPALAQFEGFQAKIIGGLSAAQIRGDEIAGFNKVGVESGIRVAYSVRYNMEVGTELLFSQRGSRSDEVLSLGGRSVLFQLNYLSIPVIWSIKDWIYESSEGLSYYKVGFQAGASYGRLLSSKVEGALGSVGTEPLREAFNENDISWIVGVNYQFNYRLGARLRYNRSITKLFKTTDNPSINYNDLVPYHLSLQLTFKI